MKNKLSALIIVVAIWFGIADIMKNFDLLKSEADQLIAKSSLYILSLGSDESSGYVREERLAKRETLIAETKEAMAREVVSETQECEGLISKAVKTNRIVSPANHARILLDQSIKETAQSQMSMTPREHTKETARVVTFDIEKFSKEAIRRANEARIIEQRAFKLRHRVPLPKTLVSPKAIRNLMKEINYEFSNGFDDDDVDASDKSKVSAAAYCPKKVSNEKRLKKLVVLLPDILQRVGE